MIKNKGIISAFAKIIIPLSYKSYLRVLLPQTAEICTIPKSLPRSFQNNFKCLFFKRLYQIDEILKYEMAVPYCGIKLVLDEDKDNPITLKSGVKYAIIMKCPKKLDKKLWGHFTTDRGIFIIPSFY